MLGKLKKMGQTKFQLDKYQCQDHISVPKEVSTDKTKLKHFVVKLIYLQFTHNMKLT